MEGGDQQLFMLLWLWVIGYLIYDAIPTNSELRQRWDDWRTRRRR